MTKTKKYKRYSTEFKREALKRSSEDGVTDKQTCEDLGISSRQLLRWRDEFRLLGNDAFPKSGRPRDDEVIRLKRELAKVKQERDFLKHAVVFAMPSGTSPRSRSEIRMYRPTPRCVSGEDDVWCVKGLEERVLCLAIAA
jgi:transposase